MEKTITQSELSQAPPTLSKGTGEQPQRQKESRYHALFDLASDAIFIHDPWGRFLEVNETACERLQYSRDELLQMTAMDIDSPDYARQVPIRIDELQRKGHIIFETAHVRCDGTVVPTEVSSQTIEYGGKPAILSIARDITARKQAEEALQQSRANLQMLFDSVDDFLFVLDMTGNILRVNPVVLARLGYSEQELLGKSVLQVHPPDRREEAASTVAEMIAGRTSLCYVPVMAKDGTQIPVETRISRGYWDGQEAMFGISRDITEQKQAEERLRTSQQRLALALEASGAGMYDHTIPIGPGTYHSERWAEILGYKLDEFPPIDEFWPWLLEHIHPEDFPQLEKDYDDFVEGRSPSYHVQIRMRHKSGEWVYIETFSQGVERDEEGRVTRNVGVMLDITERKRQEKELRESEEKFKVLAEQSPNMIFINAAGQVIYANKKCEEITGYTNAELLSADFDFLSLIAPEYRKVVRSSFARHVAGQDVEPYEYALITKDGKRIETILTSRLIDYEGQKAILDTVTDITERKQAEMALQAENSFRNAIIENAAEGLCVCHKVPDYPFIEFSVWNDRMTEITGYSMDEINRLGWYQTMYPDPDIQARAVERMARMRHGDDLLFEEWIVTRADNEKRALLISTSVLESADGQAHVLAMMHDITERKRTETALRESEQRYRALFERTNDAVFILDLDGVHLEVNQQACDLLGYTRDEMIGLSFRDIVSPNEVANAEGRLEAMHAGESLPIYEQTFRRKDGTDVPVEVNVALVHDSEGKPLHIQSIIRDITERKQVEAEREKLISELEASLARVKTLSGLLPICASCKKIRDDQGYWTQVEVYLRDHSNAEFSHGLCPECVQKLYPEFAQIDKPARETDP